jgi:hypothetical protein
MEQLIHITATYSNALLVAILPHISDVAKKLDLPIIQPVTSSQVLRFNPNPYKGHLSGSVILTNHWWFSFDQRGFVDSFTAATNWFSADEDAVEHPEHYTGRTTMTTNEIISTARSALLKLGYPPTLTHSDTEPELQGPFELQRGGHVPYCRVLWEPVKDHDSDDYSRVRVEMNTQDKTIVGFYLAFARTNQVSTPLKLDVETETQAEFQQRTKANLFVRTNAPSHAPVNLMQVR